MKTRNYIRFFVICVLASMQLPLHSQGEPADKDFPSVTLEHTEIRTLHSDIIGQDFELLISLPRSYFVKDTVYPVIYLLDPYRAFSMVKGFTDALTAPSQIIQEVILVGIGYGGEGLEARMNWALGRVRDYSPVRDASTEEWYEEAIKSAGMPDTDVTSGGAQAFLEFLDKELIPFIGSNYRTDHHTRMLSGYSFGGLFGMYALFHKPELFSKYFIGSPSIQYANDITFQYENSYAGKHSDLNAEVMMSAGKLEERTSGNIMKMEQLLLSRGYKNLALKTVIFENENHYSCYPAAMSRSLIYLFGN